MAKQPQPDRPAGSQPGPQAGEKPRKPPREKASRDPRMPWGPGLRMLLTAAILFHLAAVFVPPWFLWVASPFKATPALPPGEMARDARGNELPPNRWNEVGVEVQRPPLLDALAWFFRHYANLLYINNGYEFFSPNPTVAHVVDYEVLDDRGETIAKGRLPDLRDQWPRLFYHRHMMLVEQTQTPDHDLEGTEDTAGEYLLAQHGGSSVRMTLRIHRLLTPQQVLDGMRTDDPSTYQTVGTLTHRKGAGPRRPTRDESIPAPGTPIPGVTR
ncbi:MAG: hypothetical protein KF847_06565 [Pirellulales bacterium]|nr:hypothetical protein [Pirellulales bacterium]